LRLALAVAKGGKIMVAYKNLRRLMHGFRIQLHWHKPYLAQIKGRRRPAIENAVEVMPPGAGKACIETVRHQFSQNYTYLVRPDAGIDRVAQHEGIPFTQQINVGDLPKRMNPRISAASALHHGRLAIDPGNGISQNPLNGPVMQLDLPAVKCRTIIFECQPVAWHQVSLVPLGTGNPRRNVAASIVPLPSRCRVRSRTA
jgi:hypothetical protein